MIQANHRSGEKGFSLAELMVSIAIMGVLAALAFPVGKAYQTQAEYLRIQTILKNLMDAQELYYVENESFYPTGLSGRIRVNPGQAYTITPLNYNFHAGHTYRYTIRTTNFSIRDYKYNYASIELRTDDAQMDQDENRRADRYLAEMEIENNTPTSNHRVITQTR